MTSLPHLKPITWVTVNSSTMCAKTPIGEVLIIYTGGTNPLPIIINGHYEASASTLELAQAMAAALVEAYLLEAFEPTNDTQKYTALCRQKDHKGSI